ncbi:hypothetical protein MEO93_21840 [Dolichospermum sp. ST_sed3]|nr:hypothetical protein [Dolichospermum sp. ST_sed6]MDD1442948.1 hypothetical protein [Dolichospermum sp. ST_sed3]MDD1449205.1 hypothetical protein [Dolichospermum sp. ST_sed8]MDD1457948.1 hypothetical protein [Dolichospermum sp. ST_sed7]
MLINVLGNQERFLFARIKKRKPLVSFSQLGELKIKVHLPTNSSPRGSSNPDKVVGPEQAQNRSIKLTQNYQSLDTSGQR